MFKINERLVYVRPDGTKYMLHAPPSRVVLQEEGFGTPPLQYVTDTAPFQNGATVRSFTLRPRPVQLIIMQNFQSRAEYWDGRATLLDQIRPNRITDFNTQGKLLYYLGNNQVRQLDVLIDSGPGFAPDEGGWRKRSFTEALRFVANDPVWYDPTLNSLVISSSNEGTFPIEFPVVFETFGSSNDITYEGTWEEFPSFVITGPITGIGITNNTTDKQIFLDYTLPAGYSITITLRGVKTITRSDGLNLLNYLTPDSDLSTFSLAPDPIAPGGVNNITITGSGTSVASQVAMSWYSRFFGI